MNGILLSLVLAGVLPPELPHVDDVVDTLEVNHVYSLETGSHNFTQLLGWHGMAEDIGWWRMVKQGQTNSGESTLIPHRGADGGWYVMFYDGATMRVVRSKYQMEWHGQVDVEVNEREQRPKEERRDLRPVPASTPFTRTTPAE